MSINQSSDITKFFNEIIVTKDKVAKMKEFYSNIQIGLVREFDALKLRLEGDIIWMENEINRINSLFSQTFTKVNNFTAKTTPPELIVEHDKYNEMMALYNQYINTFYDRMNELYDLYRENFITTEINKINSRWKFHYGEERIDALRIDERYAGININSASDVVEISNNRYLVYNKDNVLYDINHKTKDCYIVNIDSKTIRNKLNILQGSLSDIYSGENLTINSIFTVKGKNSIYVLLDLGFLANPEYYSTSDIIGTVNDGAVHILAIAKYDINTKTVTIPGNTENTSKILIREKVLIENPVTIITEPINDHYYLSIDKYVYRIKIDGASSADLKGSTVLTVGIKISDIKIYQNRFLLVPLNQTVLGIFDVPSGINITLPFKTLQTNLLPLSGGDTGIINAIMYTENGIFMATDKSLWFSDDLFYTVTKDNRINLIGSTNVSLRNKTTYNIDSNGILYYLHEHKYIYSLNSSESLAMSPTRYADALRFIDNDNQLVYEGYVHQPDSSLLPGENIAFSYIDGTSYVGITNAGKILDCDIVTGQWQEPKASVTGGNTCTAFYLNPFDGILYIGTYNGMVYKASKSLLYTSDNNSQLLHATDIGGIFAFAIKNDVLYIAGYIGRVSAYDLIDNVYHPYNEYLSEYIVNNGSAIGNTSIRAMIIIGQDLIVAGNGGRIASCNMVTHIWTRYNGKNDIDETNNIDSKYYNDGSILGNLEITHLYNYLNKYLIIFGANGRIASCNLSSLSWTDYTGTPLNILSPGPPIYNSGIHSNFSTIKSIVMTDSGIVMGSNNGYISSLDPNTGGITQFNSLDSNVSINGPGISFDAYNFPYDILSLAFDIERNSIILSGEACRAATYSIGEREILSPIISKLYYIAKRSSGNDYLSSLFVHLSKESLQEVKVLYPPREESDVYDDMYNSIHYTYKNGPYIYKISSNLKELKQSVDNGETFFSLAIANTDWINILGSLSVRNIKGFVAKDGTLGFHAVVNQQQRFLFVYKEGINYAASWFTPVSNIGEFDILDFGFVKANNIAHKYLYYATLYDSTYGIEYPSPVILNKADKSLSFFSEFLTRKVQEDISVVSIHTEDNILLSMDDEGYVYTSNTNYLNIFKWTFYTLGTSPELRQDPSPVILDFNGVIPEMLKSRKYSHYVNNDKVYKPLGFYALPYSTFNFIYGSKEGNIILITMHIDSGVKVIITDSNNITNNDSWHVSVNEIDASQYMDIYANNQFLNNSNTRLSEVTFEVKYLCLFNNNVRGILGLDISYWENYISSTDKGGYREIHVMVSLDSEFYNRYINPEYRVYKRFRGKGMCITQDEDTKELIVGSYKSLDLDRIETNLLLKIKLSDSQKYTPLRSLSDLWYNHSLLMSNDINAFKIRAKVSQIEDDSSYNSINKQFAFRYEVCVINESTGQYILYEAEKSTLNTRFNNDNKTPGVFLRVKAIDDFKDDIIELYNSRHYGRQISFVRVPLPSQAGAASTFIPRGVITEDFSTIIQLGSDNKSRAASSHMVYTVKIRPLSNIPTSLDVQFYIEPYKISDDNYGVSTVTNNIKRSEYKSVAFKDIDTPNGEFSFGEPDGFISEVISDTPHLTGSIKRSNHELLPQYMAPYSHLRKGYLDTLVAFIKGRGNGRYDRLDGIVANVGKNVWSVIPYNVNRKPIVYSLDVYGTKVLGDTFDIDFLKNGRNISKMHEFGVYIPNSINMADYYIDLKDKGRIAKSEGLLLTYRGLFEGIGTMDGRQKRITTINEANEGTVYRYTSHALDDIRGRLFGYAYDFIDRYTTFEIPYYYIRSWWIPARGYIQRSNESLLTLDYDSARFDSIGKALFPFDFVSPPASISKPDYENEGGGIGSGGSISDPDVVAFSTLIREKYPLTHWEGYNDIDFVRVYKDIYVDGHVVERVEIEAPREIIPRNLYYYKDDLDWERKGKETLKYMTGYYYNAHNWKIYYHEVREIINGYSATDSQFITDNPSHSHLVDDYNASIILSDTFIEEQWYINEVPVGTEAWPRVTTEIVGERIANMTNPLVDYVIHLGSMASHLSNRDNSFQLDYSKIYYRVFRRGELYDSRESINDRGHTMIDLLNPVSSRKKLSPLTVTHADTSVIQGNPAALTSRLSALNNESNPYLVILIMSDAISVSTQLREALKSVGVDNSQTLASGGYRHLLLGSSKTPYEMFEFLDTVATVCHEKGYGYIAPIRTTYWNHGDIENINENTPWVATVKKYRADCNESTENRNMVLTKNDKKYDQYVGFSTHKYLYGTKYNVSLSLNGINPTHHSRDFYYYTVEGEGLSYYNEYSHWWDKRAPSNITSGDIVERELIGRVEPTDEDRRLGYIMREWLNDGTSRTVTDYYDFYTKWFEVNDSSVLAIPVTDEAGELHAQYTISGLERYAYYDGTVLTVPRTSTFTYLRTEFALTITVDVTYDSTPDTPYYIRRNITFIGTKVNDGGPNKFERTWSTTATYTTEPLSPDGALESTSTGKRVIRWTS